jgi:hypothetical protein
MKTTNLINIRSSWKKVLFAFVTASFLLGGCKENETAAPEINAGAQGKGFSNATTSAAMGSGWTEITAAEEARQNVHLENTGTSGGPQTEPWNNGTLAWYIDGSENMTNTYSSSATTAGYTYSSSTKTHTFTQFKNPSARSEIRVNDNYLSGTGLSRQFEGVITIGSGVWDENAVFQIWGNEGNATLMQIRADASTNGGQLNVYQNGGFNADTIGNRIIATNILNTPTRINVIHIQETSTVRGRVRIYVNGVLKFTFFENMYPDDENLTGLNYFKYGNYGRTTTTPSNSVVKWANVRLWSGGNDVAPTGTAYYKIRVRNNTNYVLNSASTTPVDGTNVDVYTNGTSDSQLWRLIPTDNGYVRIVPKSNANLVVAPTSATFSNGINVNLDNWGGYGRQQWMITPLNDGSGASKISGRLNGNYVLDCSGTPANSRNVQIWTYTPNDRQQWIVEQVTTGNP